MPRSPDELCGYPVEYAWGEHDLATVEEIVECFASRGARHRARPSVPGTAHRVLAGVVEPRSEIHIAAFAFSRRLRAPRLGPPHHRRHPPFGSSGGSPDGTITI